MDAFGIDDGKMSLHDMIESDLQGSSENDGASPLLSINGLQFIEQPNEVNCTGKDFSAVDVTAAFDSNIPLSKIDPASIFVRSSLTSKQSATASSATTHENQNLNLYVNPTTVLPVQCLSRTAEQTSQTIEQKTLTSRVSTVSNSNPTATPARVLTSLVNKTAVQQSLQLPVVQQKKPLLPPLHNIAQLKTTSHHQTLTHHLLLSNNLRKLTKESQEPAWAKPVYSYSCLIGMALKNSETGALPVSEIYSFMT